MTRVIRLRYPAWVALVAGVIAAAGCNPDGPKAVDGNVIPKGRILKNGLPLSPAEGGATNLPPGDPGFQVVFIKLGGSDAGTEIAARLRDDPPGSFDLIGPEAKGIPPGKYRVVVIMAPFGGTDALKGKYNRQNSKIEVEVKPKEDVVIDLANYP